MERARTSQRQSQALARLAGARLRALRKAQGLTQSELGAKAGLRRSHISRIEAGHRSPALETLERLTNALGVPLYSLFYAGHSLPPAEPAPEDLPAFDALVKILPDLDADQRKMLMILARKLAARRNP